MNVTAGNRAPSQGLTIRRTSWSICPERRRARGPQDLIRSVRLGVLSLEPNGFATARTYSGRADPRYQPASLPEPLGGLSSAEAGLGHDRVSRGPFGVCPVPSSAARRTALIGKLPSRREAALQSLKYVDQRSVVV